jgi:trans-2-enoyl-CoA reductase
MIKNSVTIDVLYKRFNKERLEGTAGWYFKSKFDRTCDSTEKRSKAEIWGLLAKL